MNPFNHDAPAADTPLVNVNLDGEWVQVPKGMNVIEVAHKFGKFIPHYCYHPKLSVVGNCRMCLFEMGTPKMTPDRKPVVGADGKPEIGWMPRPQIGCATQVSDGMGIRTDSKLVKECRNGVMEFLLINHPLDCPICDQAGECKLQEYSVEYGTGGSRFVEQKVQKPKNVDLGERIVLDDERCVLCSRCIRFAKEVVQDDVLGFVNRGSYNTLTCHPDKSFDNDYSLNTVDICPVGALTSKDFRFKMRVWFLKETKSICTGCATGCNVVIGSREDVVYRLTPRENNDVNSLWMCDQGRLDFHYLHDENRLKGPMSRIKGEAFQVEWKDAIYSIGDRLKTFEPADVAIIGSGRMTNEELFLAKQLAEVMKTPYTDIVPRTWQGDKFLKSADKNPNSAGAKLMGVSNEGKSLSDIVQKVRSGAIKALIVLHEDAEQIGLTAEDLERLSLVVYVGISENVISRQAHWILAGSGFSEKRGTMVNAKSRLQRLNKATNAPGKAREDWEILNDLLKASGASNYSSFEDVFRDMSSSYSALNGLTFSKVGDSGVALSL
jgi:NADH-quinone oxidoreductase subunit G